MFGYTNKPSLSKTVQESSGTPTYIEKWIDQPDGRVRYERIIPSVPEWQFFKVELLITRSFFDWCKVHKPHLLKNYVSYACAFILARNGIS